MLKPQPAKPLYQRVAEKSAMMEARRIQVATNLARERTGLNNIGTRVSNGFIQIVQWDGDDNLTAISRFMRIQDAIKALDALTDADSVAAFMQQ